MSGCIGFPTGKGTLTFESEPAITDTAVAEDAGYKTSGTEMFAVNHTLSLDGQERQIAASNHITTYGKTLDLGFFGKAKLGSFSVISTLAVEVAGQPRSPIGDYPNGDLTRLIDNRYQDLSNVDQVSSWNIQMLGQTAGIVKCSAAARFGGDEVDVYVHATKVQHNGDFVVTIGPYPQQLDDEEENVLELIRSVEHPSEAQVALTSRLGGVFFSSPRVGGSTIRIWTASIVATTLDAVGYDVGAFTIYPRQAFSVTVVTIGITLWATGGDVR